MSPDEVHAVVLAFLDQFIARSAAPDIRALRQHLADDPDARRRLDARLPNARPSEREAYDAMAAFFDAEYDLLEHDDHTGGPTLELLLDWMAWDTWPSDPSDPATQSTNDPAQWYDWISCVESTRSP